MSCPIISGLFSFPGALSSSLPDSSLLLELERTSDRGFMIDTPKPDKMKSVILMDSLAILAIGIAGLVFFLGHSRRSNAKAWGIAGSTATVTIGLILAIGWLFAFPMKSNRQNPKASISVAFICISSWAFLVLSLVNIFTSLNISHSSSLRTGALVLTAAAFLILIVGAALVISAKRMK
jgi:hypothetical protein